MEFSRIELISSMAKVSEFIGRLNSGELVKKATNLGLTGITVYNALGCGVQNGMAEYMPEIKNHPIQLLPKSVICIICETDKVYDMVEFLKTELYTGHIGDGKIFISQINNIIRVRTGEEGSDALKKSTID